MRVRAEARPDRSAVYFLNCAAFPTSAEAELVDQLRERNDPYLSYVADQDGRIVGHIFFTTVHLDTAPKLRLMGLGPMAVQSEHQGAGIGTALVKVGLQACRRERIAAVVVLGDPAYYARFGFRPAADFDLECTFDAPPGAFMALELLPGALRNRSGLIKYPELFSAAAAAG